MTVAEMILVLADEAERQDRDRRGRSWDPIFTRLTFPCARRRLASSRGLNSEPYRHPVPCRLMWSRNTNSRQSSEQANTPTRLQEKRLVPKEVLCPASSPRPSDRYSQS